jgi:hypothetical protein
MSESSNINAKYSQILKLRNDLRLKGSYDLQSTPLSEIYDWELAFVQILQLSPKSVPLVFKPPF